MVIFFSFFLSMLYNDINTFNYIKLMSMILIWNISHCVKLTDESHNAWILISSCLNKFTFIRTIIFIELITSVTIVYICMLAVYTPSHHEGYARYKLLSISVWFWCRWQSGWLSWRNVWFNLITMSSWQVWDLVIF